MCYTYMYNNVVSIFFQNTLIQHGIGSNTSNGLLNKQLFNFYTYLHIVYYKKIIAIVIY